MITVKHISSRSSSKFYDNYFEVTGVPMNNYNTVLIDETLNEKSSKYGDEAFSPKPDGSSYTIAVRGLATQTVFTDIPALQSYILEKLNFCSSKLQERKN